MVYFNPHRAQAKLAGGLQMYKKEVEVETGAEKYIDATPARCLGLVLESVDTTRIEDTPTIKILVGDTEYYCFASNSQINKFFTVCDTLVKSDKNTDPIDAWLEKYFSIAEQIYYINLLLYNRLF